MAAFAKSLSPETSKRLLDLRAWCSRANTETAAEDDFALLNVAVQFEAEGTDPDFSDRLRDTTAFGDA